MKKILVINIEIKARELNSRIMIGYEALKRGYEVVIGAQSEMYEFLKYVPKAIFLDKSISRNKLNKLKKIKRLGHKIINLDEEGIASQNNKHFYLKQRMSTETLDLTDYFFTWGDDENNLIESQFYEYKSKIKTTGNPRIELWKPEYKELYKDEVIQISNQYKDFIFITSNFALVQHARGEDFLKSQESAFSQVETQKDEEILNSQKKYFTLMHTAFLKMINVLAKSFPNRTIVIRPHPSDNIQIWKENTKEYQNVFIEYKYSATPWIIASSCMIHSSCATGIEGFLMNKPVFSFLPYKDNKFIEYISNTLSDICDTEQQLLDKISLVFQDNYDSYTGREAKKKEVKHILQNVDTSGSSKIILDYIEKIDAPSHAKLKNHRFITYYARDFLKKFVKKIIGKEIKADAYDQQKMPGISIDEIYEKLNQFQKLDNQDDDKKFKLTKIHNKSIFIINYE